MSDHTLILQRNQLMVKMCWLFLLFDIPINLVVKDFPMAKVIFFTAVPLLLLITFLVNKNILPSFTMYLISVFFIAGLFNVNYLTGDYINLFFLILPPIFSVSYHDWKNTLFTTIVSTGVFSYFLLLNGDSYFTQWRPTDVYYFLFFFVTYGAINIYESRFTEGIRIQLINELNRVNLLKSKLHESEERYRAMIKQSSEGIFAFNPKNKSIVETNERFCEMIGYEEQELLKLSIYDFIYSEQSLVDTNIENVLREKRFFVGEKLYRCKNGSPVAVEVSGTVINLKNESVILANIHDITKQKEIEFALKENEKQLRQMYENMTDMVIKTDQQYRIQSVSPACKQTTGYEANELIAHSLFANVHEDDISKLFPTSGTEGAQIFEGQVVFRYRHRNGQYIWLEATGDKLLDESGEKLGSVIVCRDITKRIKMEEHVRQTSARLEALISHIPYGIIAEDKDNGLILINKHCSTIFGIPPISEEQLGITHEEFFNKGKGNYLEGALIGKRNSEIFAGRKKVVGEEWELIDGRIIRRDAIPIFTNNKFEGYLWLFNDITEQKRIEQKLKEASLLDGLTKISNRRFFDETMAKEWARCARTSKPLTIIMLDLDYFKNYNDTYGHQDGDECLIRVAQTIKGTLRRPSDVVCRYGGEEFALILPETPHEGAVILAERIRAAIESLRIPHINSGVNEYVTCSLGVATVVPSPLVHPEDIMRRADKALYTSKTQGRNRVNLYS